MNTSEVAAALRPFYFAVHPDMFGQYPKERVRFCFIHSVFDIANRKIMLGRLESRS